MGEDGDEEQAVGLGEKNTKLSTAHSIWKEIYGSLDGFEFFFAPKHPHISLQCKHKFCTLLKDNRILLNLNNRSLNEILIRNITILVSVLGAAHSTRIILELVFNHFPSSLKSTVSVIY